MVFNLEHFVFSEDLPESILRKEYRIHIEENCIVNEFHKIRFEQFL
jgi:hypothetical protein